MGNLGAALSKLLSMIVFFVLTYYYAQKMFTIPYEMKRITLLLFIAALLYIVSLVFNPLNLMLRITLKSGLILSFPFILHIFKFYEPMELERVRSGWNKWRDPAELKNNIYRLINK
jgi:hypothetical protein